MRLTIIGAGYVGLVTGACFAEMGNKVYSMDNDALKIENLKKGIIPIYEPGLSDMIVRNQRTERLRFTTDLAEALHRSDICFIAVGTPMTIDGGPKMDAVYAAAREIGRTMSGDLLVVNKSTVPPGTACEVKKIIQAELTGRLANYRFKVLSNPEFLKEGSAITDCLSPDRIVIGAPDHESAKVLKELYAAFTRTSDRFVIMDVINAEMTKYAANAMLATRISFMNEMAGICERIGADINEVRLGIGSDSRIGYSFLFAGCGYGGSCFPKDVQALIKTAAEAGFDAAILKQVENVNQRQKKVLAQMVTRRFGDDLTGHVFAVWGLAFKPDTDDMRQAPSMVVIKSLLARGAVVMASDPKALETAKANFSHHNLHYVENQYEALNKADAMLLLTEWKAFRNPDFHEMKEKMKTPVIFDGRNQYKAASLKELGFEYYQIGVAQLPLLSHKLP